uniref:Uncharacterized protein n=1 Tax=Solanum tuberosum TaxID=4113 RepID=M1AJL3_SOLTU
MQALKNSLSALLHIVEPSNNHLSRSFWSFDVLCVLGAPGILSSVLSLFELVELFPFRQAANSFDSESKNVGEGEGGVVSSSIGSVSFDPSSATPRTMLSSNMGLPTEGGEEIGLSVSCCACEAEDAISVFSMAVSDVNPGGSPATEAIWFFSELLLTGLADPCFSDFPSDGEVAAFKSPLAFDADEALTTSFSTRVDGLSFVSSAPRDVLGASTFWSFSSSDCTERAEALALSSLLIL